MPDPMSPDPEVVALENALPIALADADDAGSEADDWTGSEYVMRMALSAVAALHAAGYRVVAERESPTGAVDPHHRRTHRGGTPA